MASNDSNHLDYLADTAGNDCSTLYEKEKEYGASWKQRGGVGAFMMLARKWDRLEKQVQNYKYDVFQCIQEDSRGEGILDDIRDLRRYLLLVEAEMIAEGHVQPPTTANTLKEAPGILHKADVHDSYVYSTQPDWLDALDHSEPNTPVEEEQRFPDPSNHIVEESPDSNYTNQDPDLKENHSYIQELFNVYLDNGYQRSPITPTMYEDQVRRNLPLVTGDWVVLKPEQDPNLKARRVVEIHKDTVVLTDKTGTAQRSAHLRDIALFYAPRD